MEYRSQKILLTGKIDEEAKDYLVWCCHQSNSLYNSALFAIRQAHFEQGKTYTFFDKYDQYRIAFKDRYVKVSYAQLCQEFKTNKYYRRITRGTYRTAKSWLISADAQGGANILKKVAIQLGISLAEVGREALTLPKRYDLFGMSKLYRKRSEAVFQPA